MVQVRMTTNLAERPPKICGLITLRQLIWSVMAVLLAVPFIIWVPMELTAKILTGFAVAVPFLVIGWYPEKETNPATIAKSFIRTKLIYPHRRTHESTTGYGAECTNPGKIRRHKEFMELK